MQSNTLTRYTLFGISALFVALAYFMQLVPISTSTHFESILHVTSDEFVDIAGIFFVFYAVMQIPTGIILDRIGIKYVLFPGLIISALGAFLYTICNNMLSLSISRAILGAGCGFAYTTAIFIAEKYLPSQRLSLFIGIIEAVASRGSILATYPLSAALIVMGWNLTNACIIAVPLVLFILALIFVNRAGDPASVVEVRSFDKFLVASLQLFKNKMFIVLLVYVFTTWAIMMSFAGYWLKEILEGLHAYSEAKALFFVQLCWGSFFVSNMVLGFLATNARRIKLILCLLALLKLINFTLYCIPVLLNEFEIAVVVICCGIGASGMVVSFSVVRLLVTPEIEGTAMATLNTSCVLGGYMGQVIFGSIYGHHFLDDFLFQHGINMKYYSSILLYPLAAFIAFAAILILVKNIRAD